MPECFKDQIFPLTPISISSSHRVFPSFRRWSSSRFPCAPDPPRAMPGSSLWREPALQAGPAGLRAASSSSSSTAGQRYLQGPPWWPSGHTGGVPAHTGSSTQTAAQAKAPAVSMGCGKTTFGFSLSGTEKQKAKHKEPTHACAHTRFSPIFQPSRVQQAQDSFLSSLGDDAETCFAGTAVFALPAFSRAAPGSRAQLLLPSPNLWVSDLFPVATEIPLHRQNVRRHEWTCFSYSVQIKVQLALGGGSSLTGWNPLAGEKEESLRGEDSAPAEVAPSHVAPPAMAPCGDTLEAHSSWETPTVPQQPAEHLSILATVLGSFSTLCLTATVKHTVAGSQSSCSPGHGLRLTEEMPPPQDAERQLLGTTCTVLSRELLGLSEEKERLKRTSMKCVKSVHHKDSLIPMLLSHVEFSQFH